MDVMDTGGQRTRNAREPVHSSARNGFATSVLLLAAFAITSCRSTATQNIHPFRGAFAVDTGDRQGDDPAARGARWAPDSVVRGHRIV